MRTNEDAYFKDERELNKKSPDWIKLLPISKDDLKPMFQARNHDSIKKWCRQVGVLNWDNHCEWYEKQRKDPSIKMLTIGKGTYDSYHEIAYDFIGVCGLTSIDLINRHAEFSLYIIPSEHRKGYASLALKELIKFGFNELGLNLIWGETFDGNPALNLFKEIGFKIDGTRRDFYYKNGQFIDAHLVSIKRSEYDSILIAPSFDSPNSHTICLN